MIVQQGEWLTLEEYAARISMDTITIQHILIQKSRGFKFKKYYCSICGYPTDVRTTACDKCGASMKDE